MSEVITDAKGRRITLRRVTVVDQYRLDKVMGFHSSNQGAMIKAETAILAAAIDGVPLPFPGKEEHVAALIERLGDEGMAVLMAHRLKEVKAVVDAADRAMMEGEKPDPLAPSEPSPSTPGFDASSTS